MPCGCGAARSVLGRVAAGGGGLLKSTLRIGVAPEEVIRARRDLCRDCPSATRNSDEKFSMQRGLTTFSVCRECGCYIAAKTRLNSESCPLKLWQAVEAG
jgi:hypothetical protein